MPLRVDASLYSAPVQVPAPFSNQHKHCGTGTLSFGPSAGFVTSEQLAKFLRKGKRTLDRWHALGIGPPRTRVGRMVLYKCESVIAWLSANQETPPRSGLGARGRRPAREGAP